jgi:hypothetical protein
MARIKGLIPLQSLRFADDYDVYVDYEKGRSVKCRRFFIKHILTFYYKSGSISI